MFILMVLLLIMMIIIVLVMSLALVSGDYDEKMEQFNEERVRKKIEDRYGKLDDLSDL